MAFLQGMPLIVSGFRTTVWKLAQSVQTGDFRLPPDQRFPIWKERLLMLPYL
jgi:hypothetical protein